VSVFVALLSSQEIHAAPVAKGFIANFTRGITAIASSDNVESTVKSTAERWLADELLERVFG